MASPTPGRSLEFQADELFLAAHDQAMSGERHRRPHLAVALAVVVEDLGLGDLLVSLGAGARDAQRAVETVLDEQVIAREDHAAAAEVRVVLRAPQLLAVEREAHQAALAAAVARVVPVLVDD